MIQYKVINRFKDRDGRIYEAGDVYPAKGKKLDEERAEFLTKKHPKYGVAFLEKVEEKEKQEEKESEAPKKTTKKKSSSKKKSDE